MPADLSKISTKVLNLYRKALKALIDGKTDGVEYNQDELLRFHQSICRELQLRKDAEESCSATG